MASWRWPPLATTSDVRFTYVPFDGAAPSRTALIGSHCRCGCPAGVDELLNCIKADRFACLAIAADERLRPFGCAYLCGSRPFDFIGDLARAGCCQRNSSGNSGCVGQGFKQCFEDPEFRALAAELAIPLVYKDQANLKLYNQWKKPEPALKAVDLLKSAE